MKPIQIGPPRVVYRCPYFAVSETDIQLENGYRHTYYSEKGIDFVVVVAEKDSKLLMVKQYRFPIDTIQLEFTAGGIRSDEDNEEAARRELLEETGYLANKLECLGSIHPLTARCSTVGHVYAASDLEDTGKTHLDRSESGLTHTWVDIEEFKRSLKQRGTLDGIMLAAWALYSANRK